VQERSIETKNRILRAEGGYNATGVVRICRVSRVSKGAFYHHFPSKQPVFLELMKSWLAEVDSRLADAMERAGNVPQGLLAMAAEMRRVFRAADGRLEIFLEFWQQTRRNMAVRRGIIAPYRRYRDLLAQIVQRGVREGSFRSVDATAAG
jgi:AcrR family transcriptional regulator